MNLPKEILPGYTYECLSWGASKGRYLLYVCGYPYCTRKTKREIVEFAKGHNEKRKSLNFSEPKFEFNYFDPANTK